MKRLWNKTKMALAEVLILPIRGYRRLISPLIPPRCRFRPTCSAYAIEALRRHGPCKGLLLAVCRCTRCQPLCKAGYDPVPETFSLRPFAGARQEEEKKSHDRSGSITTTRNAGTEDNKNV